MTDNDFWVAIQTVLQSIINDADLVLNSGENIDLVSGYQPEQQGAPEYPVATYHEVAARRYGSQGRKNKYNQTAEDFDHTEIWRLERTIQFAAWIKEDPSNLNLSTAYDVVDQVAAGLNSESVRESLLLSGIGIIRITDIRTTKFVDDRDDFMKEPNFDFIVNYTQTRESKVSQVSEFNDTIERV